jgi:thiamine-phosphate pyrophosphorylase
MPRIGRLHLITDTRVGRDALAVVAAGLVGGADTVQVRVQDATTDRDAYELVHRVRELCRRYEVACLVNDRLHLALATGADGGHVGAADLPVAAARRILGPDAILGASVRDPQAARQAVVDGASYLGVGPVFGTTTKAGLPDPIGVAGVATVASAADLPVIAIGGVSAAQVRSLRAAGAYGVAVISAVSGAADPTAATAGLVAELDGVG